jgi:hypothetical protein
LICTHTSIGVAREYYDKRDQTNAALVTKEFHRQEYGELGLPTTLFEDGEDPVFFHEESEEEAPVSFSVARTRTIWTEAEGHWIQSWIDANPACRGRYNWKKCAEDIRRTASEIFHKDHINPTSLREKYKRIKKYGCV